MSYREALGLILALILGGSFICWYLWCWHTMLFRCQGPRDFFSDAHPTSAPFLYVNALGVIFGLAWVITLITN